MKVVAILLSLLLLSSSVAEEQLPREQQPDEESWLSTWFDSAVDTALDFTVSTLDRLMHDADNKSTTTPRRLRKSSVVPTDATKDTSDNDSLNEDEKFYFFRFLQDVSMSSTQGRPRKRPASFFENRGNKPRNGVGGNRPRRPFFGGFGFGGGVNVGPDLGNNDGTSGTTGGTASTGATANATKANFGV